MTFRYRPGLGVPYERQGVVFFTSRTYREQHKRVRDKIDRLLTQCGGEYADALREYVTTGATSSAICRRYHMSEATLFRLVRRYYSAF